MAVGGVDSGKNPSEKRVQRTGHHKTSPLLKVAEQNKLVKKKNGEKVKADEKDVKELHLPTWRGNYTLRDSRNTSNAHILLKEYVAGDSDKEKNSGVDNIISDVKEKMLAKEIILKKSGVEGYKKSAIKYFIHQSMKESYSKLDELPKDCPVKFDDLFKKDDVEGVRETLGARLQKLINNTENKIKEDTIPEKFLEESGLLKFFQEDRAAFLGGKAEDYKASDLLGLPLAEIKEDRENILKVQSAQITAHLLDEQGVSTTMKVQDKDNKLEVSLTYEGDGSVDIFACSEKDSEKIKEVCNTAENSFEKLKKKKENKDMAGWVGRAAGVSSVSDGIAGVGEIVANARENITESADKLGNSLASAGTSIKDAATEFSVVGEYMNSSSTTIAMGLLGAAALAGAAFVASPIVSGAMALSGLGVMGMMAKEFGKEKFGWFNPDKKNKDEGTAKEAQDSGGDDTAKSPEVVDDTGANSGGTQDTTGGAQDTTKVADGTGGGASGTGGTVAGKDADSAVAGTGNGGTVKSGGSGGTGVTGGAVNDASGDTAKSGGGDSPQSSSRGWLGRLFGGGETKESKASEAEPLAASVSPPDEEKEKEPDTVPRDVPRRGMFGGITKVAMAVTAGVAAISASSKGADSSQGVGVPNNGVVPQNDFVPTIPDSHVQSALIAAPSLAPPVIEGEAGVRPLTTAGQEPSVPIEDSSPHGIIQGLKLDEPVGSAILDAHLRALDPEEDTPSAKDGDEEFFDAKDGTDDSDSGANIEGAAVGFAAGAAFAVAAGAVAGKQRDDDDSDDDGNDDDDNTSTSSASSIPTYVGSSVGEVAEERISGIGENRNNLFEQSDPEHGQSWGSYLYSSAVAGATAAAAATSVLPIWGWRNQTATLQTPPEPLRRSSSVDSSASSQSSHVNYLIDGESRS